MASSVAHRLADGRHHVGAGGAETQSGHLSPIQAHETVTGAIRRMAREHLPGGVDLTSVPTPIDLDAGRVRGIA